MSDGTLHQRVALALVLVCCARCGRVVAPRLAARGDSGEWRCRDEAACRRERRANEGNEGEVGR